ncbi:MAG: pilus assembly protein [Gemmatimonadetes bacterium]|nr:pilus assembly protein [Gemmatimonadota bacterium]NNK49245.1 pilus assembly protein [Gemmatimonadota bacterium]
MISKRIDRERNRAGRTLARLVRSDSGQGVAEFALVLPMILIILLGMVEFSHAYDRVHGLAGLSREGANIAARGTALSEVLTTVMANGETLEMTGRGGAIVSRIVVQSGQPTVMAQVATAGYESKSEIVDVDAAAEWISMAGFTEGSTHFAVEVFLTHEPITPLGQLYRTVTPSVLYERAVF